MAVLRLAPAVLWKPTATALAPLARLETPKAEPADQVAALLVPNATDQLTATAPSPHAVDSGPTVFALAPPPAVLSQTNCACAGSAHVSETRRPATPSPAAAMK